MRKRRLHIGALDSSPGWETLNVLSLPGVDHVCDARDLSAFPDETFHAIYASHVLEHFDYRDEILPVLSEWRRVLVPGGTLSVSVPDLDTICRLFADRERFDANDRFAFMRMILGGHSDEHDYHRAGLNEEFLRHYLEEAGFVSIRRVDGFGLFDDTSTMRYKGEPISLNMTALRPFPAPGSDSRGERSGNPGAPIRTGFSITRDGIGYSFEYLFDISMPTQRSLAAHIQGRSLYEPELSLLLMRVLREGDWFIDVGANVGFFTVIAARLAGPGGGVIAFEPEEGNVRRLDENVRLNHLSNVILIPAAAGDHEGEAELFINSDNDGGHAFWDPGLHSFNRVSRERVIRQKTRMTTIDTIVRTVDPPRGSIKALKIDTEGFEHQVLEGAMQTLTAHSIPFIFVEMNRLGLSQCNSSEEELNRFLRRLGYHPFLVDASAHDLSLRFREIPTGWVPAPEQTELVYNLLFTLRGEMERNGLSISDREGR